MSSQPRLFVKIWDRERLLKKIFLCTENIESLIKKANAAGLLGSKLVLESDGTDVEDMEVLEHFGQKNEVFQILEQTENWIPPPSTSNNSVSYVSDAKIPNDSENSNNIITWITTNDLTTASELEAPESPLSTTISMSSGRVTSISSDVSGKSESIGTKQAEKLFSDYQFPTNQISDKILDLLNQGQPLDYLHNDFIHCVVNDMRRKSLYIPQRVFRTIASRLIQIYPLSLAILDGEGKPICTEPITLATKMCNHNNYLNRISQNRSPAKSIKRKVNLSEGVANFFEKISTSNQISDEEGNIKRVWLKENYGREISSDALNKEIMEIFKSTFTQQRKFLNKNPTISEIKEYWPHLLLQNFLICHFYEMMDIQETLFLSRWNFRKNAIFEFGNRIKNSAFGNEEDEDLRLLKIITTHFKENLDSLVKKYSYGTSVNEIEIPTSTPFFAIIDQPNNNKTIYFYVEMHQLDIRCSCIKTAVLLSIAAYYAFNIQYPMELSQSLEAMQKIFLNIDVNFSRSKKQKINFKSKVVNFLKKVLND